MSILDTTVHQSRSSPSLLGPTVDLGGACGCREVRSHTRQVAFNSKPVTSKTTVTSHVSLTAVDLS